jgi:hypothetical protein
MNFSCADPVKVLATELLEYRRSVRIGRLVEVSGSLSVKLRYFMSLLEEHFKLERETY